MESKEHTYLVNKLIEELDSSDIKANDKIAVFRSAAAVVENMLTAEATYHMFQKHLSGEY